MSQATPDILHELETLIAERKSARPAGSYTTSLFKKGTDVISKKIAEEAGEVVIAAQHHNPDELRREAADLLYHLLVLLAAEGVSLDDVYGVLRERRTSPRSHGANE